MKKLTAVVLLLSIAAAATAQEAVRKYEIKSGIVKTVTTVMGQSIEATAYFDDYGAMEVSKTKTTVPGAGEMEIATISKDGKNYMVNYTAKQVQEIPSQPSINYLNLTDDTVAKFKVKELGKEMIGDRECTKYTQEISQMGQTAAVTTWVYKGIPVKSVTSIGGMEITAEVTELTEDAYILPQTFEVPAF